MAFTYILTGHRLSNGEKSLRTITCDSSSRYSVASRARVLGCVGRGDVAQLENGDSETRFIDGDRFVGNFVAQVNVLRTRGPSDARKGGTVGHASESHGLTGNCREVRWGTDDKGRRFCKRKKRRAPV